MGTPNIYSQLAKSMRAPWDLQLESKVGAALWDRALNCGICANSGGSVKIEWNY